MAEEHPTTHTTVAGDAPAVEVTDRGFFGLGGKKEEEVKPQEEAITADLTKVHVSEPVHKEEEVEEEKKPTLLEQIHEPHILHHHTSSSSSSSDDEEEVEGVEKKKKKKKGLKEKIAEKFSGEKKEEDTSVPVEKIEEVETIHPEEKKGLLEKIKDKLPGKKTEEVPAPAPAPVHAPAPEVAAPEVHAGEGVEPKEKKGILEKIKEKLPGFHSKPDHEDKEKDIKEGESH